MRTRSLPIIDSQIIKTAGLAFLASLAVGLVFFVQPNFAAAQDTPCLSHGVVTDAVSGAGLTVTITTTGTCQDAPLVLSSRDDNDIATVLTTRARDITPTGTEVSITFVPSPTAVSYDVSIDGVFAANITK
jgi:hypothetical protein